MIENAERWRRRKEEVEPFNCTRPLEGFADSIVKSGQALEANGSWLLCKLQNTSGDEKDFFIQKKWKQFGTYNKEKQTGKSAIYK